MSTLSANGTRNARRILRFGVFEFEVRTGELRKHGVKLRLQGKPLQVLQALVEHPGDVVTREELQHRLWSSDVFVDFDNGLNTAANRLRIALGDSAENPRYIETLARVGYRFIAPIEVVEPTASAAEPRLQTRRPSLTSSGGLDCQRPFTTHDCWWAMNSWQCRTVGGRSRESPGKPTRAPGTYRRATGSRR